MNKRLTKADYIAIADGIAHGREIIALAAEVCVDRSTLSGWLMRPEFMRTVALSLSSPDDLGADALACLMSPQPLDGERRDTTGRRRAFCNALRNAFPAYWRERTTATDKRAECLKADLLWNVATLVELEMLDWRDGTADELARGLDTAEKRKEYRCRNGVKWDCAGFGPYFMPRWDARRARLEYAEEDGTLNWDEQREKFGISWQEARDVPVEDLLEYNDDPLSFPRDPRLPTNATEAEALWRAVEKDGAKAFTTLPTRQGKPERKTP